jgi:O-methyltransferase involved in polyketide biosynthesis
MLPGHFAMNIAAGETEYAIQNCHENNYALPALSWSSEEYAFAESYAVWGWARFDGDCKQEFFRLVIDENESSLG